jgi:hypothetical protein
MSKTQGENAIIMAAMAACKLVSISCRRTIPEKSALILRDVMETVFLLDLFAGDRPLIERWRFADKKARMKDFSPVKVREALDARDGFTSKKRFEMYELFSELAGHPNMKSSWMMRPQKDGDAVIGPFRRERGPLSPPTIAH